MQGITTEMLLAGVVFLLGGALACFSGYRLFRPLLGLAGLAAGAWLVFFYYPMLRPEAGRLELVGAMVIGGLALASLMAGVRYVGLFLFGAGMGLAVKEMTAFYLEGAWDQALGFASALAGGAALVVWQRPVIIAATSILGAGLLTMAAAIFLLDKSAPLMPHLFGTWLIKRMEAGQPWGLLLALTMVLAIMAGILMQFLTTEPEAEARPRRGR